MIAIDYSTHASEPVRAPRGIAFILFEPTRRSSILVSPAQYQAERTEQDPDYSAATYLPGELDGPASVTVQDDDLDLRRGNVGRVLAVGAPALDWSCTCGSFDWHRIPNRGQISHRSVRELVVCRECSRPQALQRTARGTRLRILPAEFSVGDVVLYRQWSGPEGFGLDASRKLAVRFGYPDHRIVVPIPFYEVVAVLPDGVPAAGVLV